MKKIENCLPAEVLTKEGKLKIENSCRRQAGFSVIEVILATALFMILATASITTILQGLSSNRLGKEQTVANQYAAEGIEAVRSIKNQAYTNLVNTSGCGLIRNASNVWAFQSPTCTNNTFDNGKYTRIIKVESVNRDNPAPPLGNIVVSGTNDPDTKKITSTVTWNFTPSRANTVQLVSYLSDWRKPIPPSVGDAILAYLDNTSTSSDDQPEYRTYTNSSNTFGNETNMTTAFTDTQDAKTFKVKTSPTKIEAIAGYVDNGGILRIMCFDGTTWSSEWTATVVGTGTNDQRFGIAYETNTGDTLVVYSTNATTSNEMAYRTKAGSAGCGSANWSTATNITANGTNGIVQWIRMEGNPAASSNNIALAWADNAGDLSAMQWTGSGFGIAEYTAALELNLERVTTSQDVQSFDIAYESQTGNLMVVWGVLTTTTACTAASGNCLRYSRYTSSWSAPAAIPTVADSGTSIDISANPNTDQLVLAAIDNGTVTANANDMSIAYWSGSAWTGRANVDTTTAAPAAGNKLVATGWLINGATTRYVVAYNDSAATNIGWYVGNAAGAPAVQTDCTTPTCSPAFANPQRWYDIQMDPKNKDRLMFTLSDNASDLFAKRLIMSSTGTFTSPNGWSNSDGSAALETTLGQATTSPFGFAYWRNP